MRNHENEALSKCQCLLKLNPTVTRYLFGDLGLILPAMPIRHFKK